MKKITAYIEYPSDVFYSSVGEDEVGLLKGLLDALDGDDTRKTMISNNIKSLYIEIVEICPHCGNRYIQKTMTEFI